jgi:uncharacterized membrane protein
MSENIISSINIKKLILSIILLVGFDFIVLSSLSSFFNQQILDVQKTPLKFRFIPAIFCYAFMVIGLNYFVLQRDSNVMDAIILGLVINGVYETTNMVLLQDWRLTTAMVDTIWGGVLYGLTTFIINNIMTIFG